MNPAIKKRPVITLDPVVSKQLHSIGHDPETQTLAIQFHGKNSPGSTYHYANFSSELFEEFKNSESIGSHFIKFIKPAGDRFPHTKID